MMWNIPYSEQAVRQLRKMDQKVKKLVLDYLDEIAKFQNPFSRGQGLIENRKETWRYGVADLRILCEIRDMELIIHVFSVAHRREVYS